MHRIFLAGLSFLVALSTGLLGQSNYPVLKGKITDEKGNPLAFANVVLKEINNGATTDNNGAYKIIARPGNYTVEASFIGYEKVTENISLVSGRTVIRDIKLKSTSFVIGGIEVVANNEFIPINPETKTTISAGEIEHIQAASLNDVLKMTPGVETTTNPNFENPEKASIRHGDALGTQIVLDGVPLTNNANMQVDIGYSTANSGVDLRSIPAENIKEVEIIRGVPSAQYGDLADGLLIVKTKSSAEPLRAKYKYNPRINEINLSGGFNFNDWIFNSNFNVASSDRDIRVEGDGYTRLAGQISADRETEDFSFKNIIYITRSLDESKEKPGYELRDAWYNRDLNVKYTGKYSRTFSSFSGLNLNFSLSYTSQDSYSQQMVSRDNIVITTRLDEGSEQGRIVFGSYLGQKWIKGDVWNLFSDFNYNFRFFTDNILHSWIAGLTWRDDFNKGDGVIFDPNYPPSLSIPTQRIRTYNELPHYNIISLYAEDRITGRLFRPFTLQLGLRYEVYRPNGFNIKGLWGAADLIESYNGSFLNPRINFSYNISEETQLRLSYGVTSKSPPMGMIFAQKKYFDIVDTVSVHNPVSYPANPVNPAPDFAIISTYIRQQANEYLKGYKQSKYEVSLDQQIGSMGLTLTGFYNNSDNMFQSFSEPTYFYKKSFANWPDQSVFTTKDSTLDDYQRYANNAWQKVSGIEFSFRTRRLPVINTVFKFDAVYTYQQEGTKNGYYFGSPRNSTLLGIRVMPMYNSEEDWNKDLLLNYRFEIQARSLGMWITLHVQQKAIEIDGRKGYGDVLAIGYYTQNGQTIYIPEAQRADSKYKELARSVEDFQLNDEDKPNKWLFNIKVSKSLWSGTSVSFFVNNFLNNQPLYMNKRSSSDFPTYTRRNPEIYYGLEFSSALGGVFE